MLFKGVAVNIDLNTQTVAEIFADTADVFSDAVDVDALRVLLNYCFQLSGLQRGKVVLDAFNNHPQLEVKEKALSHLTPSQSEYLVDRSRFTLNTEFTFTQDKDRTIGHYVFPLRVRGASLGVVQLFSVNQTPLNGHALGVLQSVVDIAATTIDQTHKMKQAHLLASQLQGALDSRVVIEQAKGVIAERQGTDFSQAFHELRSMARKEQRPIHAVAADVVALHHCTTALNHTPQK